ncbi:MAG: sulfotransferase [Sphingomonadales bacterium]|jgi:tetratricopeptide (TPR) repeat protein
MTDQKQLLKDVQKQIYDGRFDEALKTLEPVLIEAPDNVDALYMQAVCHRYLKHDQETRSALTALKTQAPEFGRAYQEEGHFYRDIGELKKALTAYRQANVFNPGLEASWRAQAAIFSKMGRKQEAAWASAQGDRLKALPKALLSVTMLIFEGKTLKAEQLCRKFLQKHPHHVEAMRLLADIGVRLGVLDDADFLLESALEFDPDNIQIRLDYIAVLNKRQKHQAALKQAKSLYAQDPENPQFQSLLAISHLQLGNIDEALELFESVLKKLPNDPATLTSRGHALKTYGHQEEAIASYKAAIAAKADHGDAYYALANLKTYDFKANELKAMKAQEEKSQTSHHDRIHLCFALGKGFEDAGDYEQSFHYYARGNALKKQSSRYNADHMHKELEAQKAVCTPALFDKQSGLGSPKTDPIFILGLPRAGSTLLEQILASHSQIDGTLELPHILATAQKLKGRNRSLESARYPSILHELNPEQLAKLGEDYIEKTKIYRENAPYFTDKMPNNFRHIGLIHLILPNAKIIDARRNAMDCCFSGFKQLFAEGQEFTYGLEDIGRYYKDYVELMDHWDKVLPGKILRVQYEDVVADTENQVHRILDYLGLPFEQACVDFHKTKRAVRTASSEQVRQKINTKGVDQWRHFEPWLGPLKEALGPLVEV